MKHLYHILLCFLVCFCGCSTRKNTPLRRTYHEFAARYNVYFNGNEAFKEGLAQIAQDAPDDYSAVLPLYPISSYESYSSQNMNTTIEKCRKCIKTHSITVKPKRDPRKQGDAKYEAWYAKEEFNNQMDKAWLLLGAAEYHNGQYEECIGTFRYVMRHYADNQDVIAQCQLWITRAYIALGWIYDAEDLQKKVQQDNLKRQHSELYPAVSAELLLTTKKYAEAIPMIENAVKAEKRKGNKPRFYYILGQLYKLENNPQKATKNFKKVLWQFPENPKILFNTKLQIAQLEKNPKKAIKRLKRMSRDYKNQEHLDKIYGGIGNVFLQIGDTANAITYYRIALDSARRASIDKGEVLLQLASIYYDRREFVQAYPLYQEAQTIFSKKSPNYALVQQRTELLDELTPHWKNWKMQDSLQRIAHFTPKQQQEIIEKIIDELKVAEQKQKEQEEYAKQLNNSKSRQRSIGLPGVDKSRLIGNLSPQDWYFYNNDLIKNGQRQFISQWGDRPLEDNWRRQSKNINTFAQDAQEQDEIIEQNVDNEQNTTQQNPIDSVVDERYTVEYYLKQIPKTPEDFAQSDAILSDALFHSIIIIHKKANNYPLYKELFDIFQKRFSNDDRLAELYYYHFLYARRQNADNEANDIKQRLLNEFPESSYAKLLSQASKEQIKMAQEVENLYKKTFDEFQKGNYSEVISNTDSAKTHYATSSLIPRFLFLNSIATAKSQGKEAFTDALKEMVKKYPENELSAKAKDMLSLLGQGKEAQQGNLTINNLNQARQQSLEDIAKQKEIEQQNFSDITNELSFVLICTQASDSSLNQLVFDIALFNFSQFMVKDFDLKILPYFAEQKAIRLSIFENYNEAMWYKNKLEQNDEIKNKLQDANAQVVAITESNFAKMGSISTLNKYILWSAQNLKAVRYE